MRSITNNGGMTNSIRCFHKFDKSENHNMSSKIFISYSRKDLEVVMKLRDEIHSRTGVRPWMDITGVETGTQFADVIAKNIEACELLVFVMSCNSVKSSWTRKEVLYALNHGKKIFPVVIDNAQLPRELDLLFSDLDRVDVRDSVQREKLFTDIVSFCVPHGFCDSSSASGDVMLEKQSTWAPVKRTGSAGKRRTFGLRAVVACAILVFGCILVGVVWYMKCLRHVDAEKQHVVRKGEWLDTGRTVASKSDETNKVSIADAINAHSSGTGLIIKNGKILTGKEAEEGKRHLEQSARSWENSSKICNELNLEAITLRRKLGPFV